MITHLVDTDRIIDYLHDKRNARSALGHLVEQGSLATSIVVVAELKEGLLQDGRPEVAAVLASLSQL